MSEVPLYNRSRSSLASQPSAHIDWYVIAEQPAHLAHPKGCAALRIVLVAVHRVHTPGYKQGRLTRGAVTSTIRKAADPATYKVRCWRWLFGNINTDLN